MPSKKLMMLLMLIGSVVGGYIPVLFGVNSFSFTSLFAAAAGGIIGIWLAFRLHK